MRTLAIDLGARRVGFALSDSGGKLATPYDVIEVASPEDALEKSIAVIEREGVERIVIGLPLNMDDTIGPAAKQAIEWGKSLASRAELAVVFVDERLSSFDAEQRLNDRKRSGEKMTRRQKKNQLDAIAAAGFLQAFLDAKLNAIDV